VIKEHLVKEAKYSLGQPALAFTDHGVMHGAIEFFRACKDAGVKPLIGVEAYQTVWGRPMGGRDAQFDKENYHLLLLARNMTGYRNLLKIASTASSTVTTTSRASITTSWPHTPKASSPARAAWARRCRNC
jgi:DNA polymerase III alpha subunit